MSDEFYNGLEPRAPRGVARFVRGVAAALFGVAIVVAALLATGQGRFDPGTFEYGVESELRGVAFERPVPLLVVPQGVDGSVTYTLVASGKHGAADLVAGLDGRAVAVTGSRIATTGAAMLEAHDVVALEGDEARRVAGAVVVDDVSLGAMTLTGEIVDSKCHFGVMKPGRGVPHRECAILCIRGGIPPVLRVEDGDGGVGYLLLVGPRGESVGPAVLDHVAEPVEITGEVRRSAGLLVLRADPATIRRL